MNLQLAMAATMLLQAVGLAICHARINRLERHWRR
jgi:hypothetical protein